MDRLSPVKYLFGVLLFLASVTVAYGSDFEEKSQSDCRVSFGAAELEFAYGSCFQLKKSKRGQCVESAEYRIIQNDDYVIMVDYVIIKKVECRFTHSATTTSVFRENIENWPYIKENLSGVNFLITTPILGKKTKLYSVELGGFSNCIGIQAVNRQYWLNLTGVVCSKANVSDEVLIEISSSLNLKQS